MSTSRRKYTLVCDSCGDEFHPFKRNARFCSQLCSKGEVPAARLAEIINRVLPEFGGDPEKNPGETGSIDAMGNAVAMSSGMSNDAALRRIHDIRTGKSERVSLRIADEILTGLGLTHLWHTELADLKDAA